MMQVFTVSFFSHRRKEWTPFILDSHSQTSDLFSRSYRKRKVQNILECSPHRDIAARPPEYSDSIDQIATIPNDCVSKLIACR